MRKLFPFMLALLAASVMFVGCAAQEDVAEPTTDQTAVGDNVVNDEGVRQDSAGAGTMTDGLSTN